MMAEEQAHRLLAESYDRPPAEIFGDGEGMDEMALEAVKIGADLLVAAKLARFVDDGRTQIEPTGAGRYWALHGGYLAFLKEEPAGRGGGRRNPELEAMRLDYMKLRLDTFWWSFGLSIASFVFSIASLAVALTYGDKLLR